MSPIRVARCRPATCSSISGAEAPRRLQRGGLAGLVALGLIAIAGPSRAEAVAANCLYASRSYSEGAVLCVQKAIALVCRSDAGRFAWGTVNDRDLADRCTSPDPVARSPRPRVRTAYRMRHRDHVVGPAKCFDFNGKHYCE